MYHVPTCTYHFCGQVTSIGNMTLIIIWGIIFSQRVNLKPTLRFHALLIVTTGKNILSFSETNPVATISGLTLCRLQGRFYYL